MEGPCDFMFIKIGAFYFGSLFFIFFQYEVCCNRGFMHYDGSMSGHSSRIWTKKNKKRSIIMPKRFEDTYEIIYEVYITAKGKRQRVYLSDDIDDLTKRMYEIDEEFELTNQITALTKYVQNPDKPDSIS